MNRGTRAALVAMACGALVGVPALARAQQQDPATGSVVAEDVGANSGRWVINGDANAATVTIATGGTVSFSYPTGASHHNVAFSDAQPTSCTGLPTNPFVNGGPGWSGSCRFDHPGTYAFVCSVHPFAMTGTVVVKDPVAGTPTPTPPPGGATPTPTPAPGYPYATPTPTPSHSPAATLRGAVKLAAHQKGTHVRGSVKVKPAHSRLEVVLTVKRSVIRGGHSTKQVRVGRWRKTAGKAGRVSFSVALTTTGRAAQAKLLELPLTVTVTLTPPHGHKVTRKLHVTLRRG